MVVGDPVRKLLFLLPFPPRLDAAHGGSRVMAELLVRLAKRHRVALLYLRADGEPAIDQALHKACEVLCQVNRPTSRTAPCALWSLRLRIMLSFIQGKPIWATVWSVPAYRQKLRKLVKEWQPEIIQVEYHIMGQYLGAIPNFAGPRVLTEYESGSRAARDSKQVITGYQRVLHSLDRRVWDRYERRILGEIDTAVVFTEQDRRELWKLSEKTPIVRIPLQVTAPAKPLNPIGKAPPRLLFVGNFMHPPNVDAAFHLVQDIFPAVQAQAPDARLIIVGDEPPAGLRQMAGEQIVVTGLVPDVTPYLDEAAVVLAPLRIGGGMRVKVLEALAAGKAVVAYPLAVEGLEISDGQHAAIAQDEKDFVACILQLLGDEEQRRSMAGRAHDWTRRNLSWQRSVEAYEDLYTELLRAHSPAENATSLLDVV